MKKQLLLAALLSAGALNAKTVISGEIKPSDVKKAEKTAATTATAEVHVKMAKDAIQKAAKTVSASTADSNTIASALKAIERAVDQIKAKHGDDA